MTYHLQQGLTEDYRIPAARLYWQAFGGKLGAVLGPEPRAMAFLTRVMRLDHCVAALDDQGNLLGVAGYRSATASFAGGASADLRAIYGLAGMAWRLPLLAFLSDEDARFLLDGISVDRGARSQGIGAALIGMICDLGRAAGQDMLRLDVIDSNWRARALYERLGFVIERRKSIGALRFVFGFDQVVTMAKPLI